MTDVWEPATAKDTTPPAQTPIMPWGRPIRMGDKSDAVVVSNGAAMDAVH
ncbi:hypothetical protein PA7_24410 [Pseudonocardia asaccharolytica DSM 44247 = NBRC 16224]|uniref:Uncharacterized protein n=1 Tax=Pseudonocardia asaccharolytica DSM 44247 = NBRC 16224 TaxID=1123024 RepID=A0A511D4S7_9PSEU|nr:hypothetical protein PA7_24410 [Pseudonocardia asaccharolytica DSM 44247 = NBRC 16224]